MKRTCLRKIINIYELLKAIVNTNKHNIICEQNGKHRVPSDLKK